MEVSRSGESLRFKHRSDCLSRDMLDVTLAILNQVYLLLVGVESDDGYVGSRKLNCERQSHVTKAYNTDSRHHIDRLDCLETIYRELRDAFE